MLDFFKRNEKATKKLNLFLLLNVRSKYFIVFIDIFYIICAIWESEDVECNAGACLMFDIATFYK